MLELTASSVPAVFVVGEKNMFSYVNPDNCNLTQQWCKLLASAKLDGRDRRPQFSLSQSGPAATHLRCHNQMNCVFSYLHQLVCIFAPAGMIVCFVSQQVQTWLVNVAQKKGVKLLCVEPLVMWNLQLNNWASFVEFKEMHAFRCWQTIKLRLQLVDAP